MLEATGGPTACVRCGRPAPTVDDPAWGGRFHNGRLIALACPACLTATERAEIAERSSAQLWEVIAARRAGARRLRGLADAGWLGRLDPDADVIGLVVAEPDEPALEVLWVGSLPGGRPVAAFGRVDIAAWAALDEVYVPERARRLAQSLLEARPG